jgi:hypothetical protein
MVRAGFYLQFCMIDAFELHPQIQFDPKANFLNKKSVQFIHVRAPFGME